MPDPIGLERHVAEAIVDELLGERLRELLAAEAERDAALAEVEALKGARLLSVLFGHHEGAPKPFALQRRQGRVLVALGAEFPDGAVALRLANDGGWTTKSTGGAEQFGDANTEILWLSDELESLAAMEVERDAMRPVVEAARVWRAQFSKPADTKYPRMGALIAAVDTLDGAP